MYSLLIVDNEKKLRERTTSLYDWNNLGFEVEVCLENGKLTIDYILRHPVNAVLCDIHMLVLDGIAFAKYIHDQKIHTKVVLFSSYSDFELTQKVIRYQIADYILKPITYMEVFTVFSKIEEVLDSEYLQTSPIPGTDQGNSLTIPYVKRYVSENPVSTSLNKISLEFNLAPNYLSKLFRKQVDITFTEYLMQEKMNHVCQLLQNVNFKVYEVSLMYGYDNSKGSVKTFHQFTGCTLQEYRKGCTKY